MSDFTYDDFLNGSRNLSRKEMLKYFERIGIEVSTRNGTSHIKIVNAAGSMQNVPMHNEPVYAPMLHEKRKFVDEHLAAIAPKQQDAPPAPAIHIDDEDAIEAAGLQVHALSQENRTVTLTDSHYPEIAVMIHLHDDLAVTDSHIKAAVAERDALVNTYKYQLGHLKADHNVQRVMVDDVAQLQIISRSSGSIKRDTKPVILPTLDAYETIDALDNARDEALHAMGRTALQLEEIERPVKKQRRQRPAEERAADFERMKQELLDVGLEINIRRVNATSVAYCIGYRNTDDRVNEFSTIAERFFALNVNHNAREIVKTYAQFGVNIKKDIDKVKERFSSGEDVLFYTVSDNDDTAPSEEALAAMMQQLKQFAESNNAACARIAQTSYQLKSLSGENAVGYALTPTKHYTITATDEKLGILSHTTIRLVRQSYEDTLIGSDVLSSLYMNKQWRFAGGAAAYEELIIEALAHVGLYPVLHTDTQDMYLSFAKMSDTSAEFSRMKLSLTSPNEVVKYLDDLARNTTWIYAQKIPERMARHGWSKMGDNETSMTFRCDAHPDMQVQVPHFDGKTINFGDIKRACNQAFKKQELADEALVQQKQAVHDTNDITRCIDRIDALKQLGYCLHAGKARLFAPQNIASLNAVTYRTEDELTAKPHAAASYLKQLDSELHSAQAKLAEQTPRLDAVKQAFGDKIQLDGTGMTLLVPNKNGDDIERSYAFVKNRDGQPTPFMEDATLRAMEALLSPAERQLRAERYAQKSASGVLR